MASQTFIAVFVLFMLSSDMSTMVLGRKCRSNSEKFKGICILSANCETVCKIEGFLTGTCIKPEYKCVCEKDCGVLKPTSVGDDVGDMVMINDKFDDQPMMQNLDLLPNTNMMVNPNFGDDVSFQNPTVPSTQNYNNPPPVSGFGDDLLPVRGSSGDDGIVTDLRPIQTDAAPSPSPFSLSPSPSPYSYSYPSDTQLIMQTAADSDGEFKEEFQLLP